MDATAAPAPARRMPPPPSEADLAAMREATARLAALHKRRAKGLARRRHTKASAEEFAAAFAPVVRIVGERLGRVMEGARKVRTQPEEEAVMRAASAVLFDLAEAGLARPLGPEAAALAVLTFYVGDFKDALYFVNIAAKADPDEPLNKLNGAVLAAEFFDFPLAVRLVDEVLRGAPDLEAAWALKARALSGLRLAEEAKAAQLEKRGDAAGARALRRVARERVDGAASALREVVRLAPGDPDAWYSYGKFLFTHSRLSEAAGAYARAVALDPSMKLAWYQKGTCHQMLEQPREAIEAFERGLALDQRDAGGYPFRLAAMHALEGRTEEAFRWIQAGLAINKPNFYSEIYRIEFAGLWGDLRWERLVAEFFADTGFQHTKAAQAEIGFSWGLFEYGSALFYDSLADAFGAAEALRREGDAARAREYYAKLIELLDRDGHPLKGALVRRRLETLDAPARE